MDNDDVFRRTAANPRRAADLLAGLTPEQWSTPSLCAGWTAMSGRPGALADLDGDGVRVLYARLAA